LGAQSAECTQYRDTYIRGNISRLAGQEQLLLWALPVWAAGTSQSASRGKKIYNMECLCWHFNKSAGKKPQFI